MTGGRLKTFSLVYGVAYMAFFFQSEMYRTAFFRYYPVLGSWSREALPIETAGPPILWYSWLAAALVVAVLAMVVVPRKVADRIPASWVWIVGLVLVLVIIVYERRWFY
jgi:hypothetical protein